MLTNNTYFENLKRIGHEYEAARVERQARKQQIINTLGWEGEDLPTYSEALKLYAGRMISVISAVGPICSTISSMGL